MQVPSRKIGKYHHLKPDPNLTLEKFNDLKYKLERLKKISQPKAILEVRRLAEMGDFSDNEAYSMAKGRLRGINQGIIEIEDHLKRAVIIKPTYSDRVVLGSQVVLLVNGKEKSYTLLGSAETDPERGIISHNSPIGQAIMNKKCGDTVEIQAINKTIIYKIVQIS
ncbi:MAG: GreA/GreB family elongation factor [bacterium]